MQAPVPRPIPAAVVGCFPQISKAGAVEFLGNAGGFSGARFWRVRVGEIAYCLRRWPADHPSSMQLAWIHSLMGQARHAGCRFVPRACPAWDGRTFAQIPGEPNYWELTDWMPGQALSASMYDRRRIEAAFEVLAQFHQAVLAPERPSDHCSACPAATTRRLALAGKLVKEPLADWLSAIDLAGEGELAECARQAAELMVRLAPRCLRELHTCQQIVVAQQPCLRDIWHDHLLFTGDQVTGLVDFGASGIDTVATDLARLLGSIAADDQHRWQVGLSAYQRGRPLSVDELRLLPAYDLANVVLSARHWLVWLYVERRRFDDIAVVLTRLRGIVARLMGLDAKS